MHRVLLAGVVVLLGVSGLQAQPVPARDLWEFPLGAVLEPAALAAEPSAGLWNPAGGALRSGERLRIGVASLAAGSAQSVDGQLLSFALRQRSGTTFGLSVARTSVADLVRTDTDPQAIGDVVYASLLISGSASRELLPHVTGGIAIRWREGRADRIVDQAVAADLGVVLHDLPVMNARVAASSFLWRPGRELEDRPAFVAAADVRVRGSSPTNEVRTGYSFNGVNRGAQEQGPFLSARFQRVEGRAAYLLTAAGAGTVSRFRSGLVLYYARYVVGIGREEGASGLGPLYQFTLSSVLR